VLDWQCLMRQALSGFQLTLETAGKHLVDTGCKVGYTGCQIDEDVATGLPESPSTVTGNPIPCQATRRMNRF
jgi:hypothetical protein